MHAVVPTVIALVCFKGRWVWLDLGVVLAVLLPLLYMVIEYRSLKSIDTNEAATAHSAASQSGGALASNGGVSSNK